MSYSRRAVIPARNPLPIGRSGSEQETSLPTAIPPVTSPRRNEENRSTVSPASPKRSPSAQLPQKIQPTTPQMVSRVTRVPERVAPERVVPTSPPVSPRRPLPPKPSSQNPQSPRPPLPPAPTSTSSTSTVTPKTLTLRLEGLTLHSAKLIDGSTLALTFS